MPRARITCVSPTARASKAGWDRMSACRSRRRATVTVDEGASRSGGGTVYIRGRNVAMDQASVVARTAFANGRSIDIEGTDDVTIRASEVIAVTTGAGNAGRIRLAGRNVIVLDGSVVDTSADPGSTTGNGGLLEVQATDSFIIRSTTPGTSGAAYVISNSFGGGHTGEIHVDAGTFVIDGNAFLLGLALATGDATLIQLRTGDIILRNGGQVDVTTRAQGHCAAIAVDNAGSIRVEGGQTAANGLIFPSGFFANAERSGNAGSIAISTRTLDVIGGGEISRPARPGSRGQGGSSPVKAAERIRTPGPESRGTA